MPALSLLEAIDAVLRALPVTKNGTSFDQNPPGAEVAMHLTNLRDAALVLRVPTLPKAPTWVCTRAALFDLIELADQERVTVTRRGVPVAAVIGMDDLARLEAVAPSSSADGHVLERTTQAAAEAAREVVLRREQAAAVPT